MSASKYLYHLPYVPFTVFHIRYMNIHTIVIAILFVRSTSGASVSPEFTENGLVRDGTPCGRNLVCVNQTCVSLFPYIDQTKCPASSNGVECFGQGVSNSSYDIRN